MSGLALPQVMPVLVLLLLFLPLALASLARLVELLLDPLTPRLVAGWSAGRLVVLLLLAAFAAGDLLGLWFAGAVALRVVRHAASRRIAGPTRPRARRLWGVLQAAVRLNAARVLAPERSRWAQVQLERGVPLGRGSSRSERWRFNWEESARARRDRQEEALWHSLDLGRALLRAAGPPLAAASLGLVAFGVRAFFALGLPWWRLPRALDGAMRLLGAVATLRILADFARASLMDPGFTGPAPPAGGAATPPDVELDGLGGLARAEAARWCAFCARPKPPRCHHCRTCERCVLKMDHHCPFLGNCVGQRNYPYFCLLLLDLVAGSALLLAVLLPQAPSVLLGEGWVPCLGLLAAVLVPWGALALLGPFFLVHLRLVLRDETSLEHLAREEGHRRVGGAAVPRSGPAGEAGVLARFARVFGAPPASWRLPLERALRKLGAPGDDDDDDDCCGAGLAAPPGAPGRGPTGASRRRA
ncbi:unnamed protein product [Prorocentrum cordatum]|uniref:Palmitoyltransferase n=1 Tax=Prorocentrum cordatum TaxID=2364126 RepID=A0ABN9WUZ4_9DINO|nr:unnamed protein product [Polarella glacialis]